MSNLTKAIPIARTSVHQRGLRPLHAPCQVRFDKCIDRLAAQRCARELRPSSTPQEKMSLLISAAREQPEMALPVYWTKGQLHCCNAREQRSVRYMVSARVPGTVAAAVRTSKECSRVAMKLRSVGAAKTAADLEAGEARIHQHELLLVIAVEFGGVPDCRYSDRHDCRPAARGAAPPRPPPNEWRLRMQCQSAGYCAQHTAVQGQQRPHTRRIWLPS
jgi:hypothetical protein